MIANHKFSKLNISFFYIKMTKEKSYCPTCGHVIAKKRTNLSSLEFRRLIHKINTIEGLIDNKECLSRFIKSSYNKDFADQFLEDLEGKIIDQDESCSEQSLSSIKLWLLGFINNENCALLVLSERHIGAKRLQYINVC